MATLKAYFRKSFSEDFITLEKLLKHKETEIWGGFYGTYIAFNVNLELFIRYKKDGETRAIIIFEKEEAIDWQMKAYNMLEEQSQELNAKKWVALLMHQKPDTKDYGDTKTW